MKSGAADKIADLVQKLTGLMAEESMQFMAKSKPARVANVWLHYYGRIGYFCFEFRRHLFLAHWMAGPQILWNHLLAVV